MNTNNIEIILDGTPTYVNKFSINIWDRSIIGYIEVPYEINGSFNDEDGTPYKKVIYVSFDSIKQNDDLLEIYCNTVEL